MKRERQEPQAPSDAKVEQRHRDEAVLALWGAVIGKQEPSELSSAPAVQPIAQSLANAEAAGYAAGVKDEREACVAWLSAADYSGLAYALIRDRARSDAQAPARRADAGPFGKWEIEPALSSEHDLTYTNDDNEAFDIATRVLERLWDDMEPGDTRTLRITLNRSDAHAALSPPDGGSEVKP